MTGFEGKRKELKEPLLTAPPSATPPGPTEHAQTALEIQDSFHSVGEFREHPSSGYLCQHDRQTRRGEDGEGPDMTAVDLPAHTQ